MMAMTAENGSPYALITPASEDAVRESRRLLRRVPDNSVSTAMPVTFLKREHWRAGEIASLTDALREIAMDCATPDWDGNQATPVSENSIRVAENLIGQLKTMTMLPLPEISPTPNGTLLFDWEKNDAQLVIETSGDEFLTFALLGAGQRIKGRERFVKTLPNVLREVLTFFC
jgi:hypothetical protein